MRSRKGATSIPRMIVVLLSAAVVLFIGANPPAPLSQVPGFIAYDIYLGIQSMYAAPEDASISYGPYDDYRESTHGADRLFGIVQGEDQFVVRTWPGDDDTIAQRIYKLYQLRPLIDPTSYIIILTMQGPHSMCDDSNKEYVTYLGMILEKCPTCTCEDLTHIYNFRDGDAAIKLKSEYSSGAQSIAGLRNYELICTTDCTEP